jgi:uncharacterized protein (TIGR02147 family)
MNSSAENSTIDLYDYIDYRCYLHDYYQQRKSRHPYFSCRYIAQKVGFRSASFFSQLLKGRCNMSPAMALRFAKFLKLNKRQTDYFEALVQYCQAKTHDAKRRAFERLMSCRGAKVSILNPDRFAYFDNWYFPVIRELLHFYPFDGDYRELASLVHPPIRPDDARRAISVLTRLGLIRKESSGRYVRCDQCGISTGAECASVVLDSYHKSTLDQAGYAIEQLPRDERTISTLTLSLSEEAYCKIDEELAAFRRRVMDIAANDRDEERVYQYNFQVYPVTRRPATPKDRQP